MQIYGEFYHYVMELMTSEYLVNSVYLLSSCILKIRVHLHSTSCRMANNQMYRNLRNVINTLQAKGYVQSSFIPVTEKPLTCHLNELLNSFQKFIIDRIQYDGFFIKAKFCCSFTGLDLFSQDVNFLFVAKTIVCIIVHSFSK